MGKKEKSKSDKILSKKNIALMITVLLTIVFLPAFLLTKWLIVIGLIFDLIGAILITIELVYQYHGKKYTLDELVMSDALGLMHSPDDIETKKYKSWQIRKYKSMWWGLVFLVAGFLLQIIGAWPC